MKAILLVISAVVGFNFASASDSGPLSMDTLEVGCSSGQLLFVGQFQKTETVDLVSTFQGSIQVTGVETAFNEVTPAKVIAKVYPAGSMYKNFDNTIIEMITENKGETVAFKSSLNVKGVRNDMLVINRKVVKANCEIK